jgi:hypothetical protein
MKQLIAIIALLAATSAHASVVGANHGNHSAAGLGPAGGQHAAGQAGAISNAGTAGQSGNGGSYSMVDNYQPWPQSEMAQFQKKEFVVYTGD